MLNWLRIFLLVVALVIGIVFAFYNLTPVQFDYLFGVTQWPLVSAMAVTLVLGYALGLVSLIPKLLRLRTDLVMQRRRTANAETELKNLRNLPLSEP